MAYPSDGSDDEPDRDVSGRPDARRHRCRPRIGNEHHQERTPENHNDGYAVIGERLYESEHIANDDAREEHQGNG